MSPTAAANSGRSRDPQPRYLILSNSGAVCDLTDLIRSGAKLTVLYDQLCRDWNHKGHVGDWAYARLRRACISWEEQGYVTIDHNAYDSSSVELSQRPGLYVRAKTALPSTPPYLIRGMQNSKSLTEATKRRIFRYHDPAKDGTVQLSLSSTENQDPTQKQRNTSGIPWTDRMSWQRKQALRVLSTIQNAGLFQRVPDLNGNKVLNPELKRKLDIAHALFQDWIKETSHKKIILRKLGTPTPGKDPYLIMNCRTRFNDVGRAIANEITYKDAIENSLKLYKTGVFLTLTTDPQIWMRANGEEFTRHIKDGKKTHHFSATGKGLNILAANRHESTAWRKWYEAECYRCGYRIPYIRVVEFQKNGLIHTHVLLFGIEWNTPWYQFAKQWGEKYQQGFMNKAYKINNIDGKWCWEQNGAKPEDTKGRDPADYLMKYLKKAQHQPQVTCPHCGHVMYSTGETTCEVCHTKIKPHYDGRFMYWVCGKRFFTVSNILRSFDADKEIEEFEKRYYREIYGADYEFLGAVEESLVDDFIRKDSIKRKPPIRDIYISRPMPEEFKVKWPFEDEFKPSSYLPQEETPDQTDDQLTAANAEPDLTEYEKMLREERKLMEQRRERLKKKHEERSG